MTTRTVVVTHEEERDDALIDGLSAASVRVLRWPSVRTAPPRDPGALKAHVHRLESGQWVAFTSRRAVASLAALDVSPPAGVRAAAVGRRVATAAREAGWSVEVVGAAGGVVLAETLRQHLSQGDRVLFPAGRQASDALVRGLEGSGALVTRVEAYRTEPVSLDAEACRLNLEAGVDAVSFLSPSAVMSTRASVDAAGCGSLLREIPAACIGATTGAAARETGFVDVRESATPHKRAVARLVLDLLRDRSPATPQTSR